MDCLDLDVLDWALQAIIIAAGLFAVIAAFR
jgi:hypothetical protein